MSQQFQEPVKELLQSLMENTESELMMDMLEAANQSFIDGINDFLEKSGKKIQPAELKSFIRIYPMAQVLISITKYHELNQDTDALENTIFELIHSLQKEHSERTVH